MQLLADTETFIVEVDNVIIGVVYYSPHTDCSLFLNDLEYILIHLDENNNKAVIVGDMTIDALSSKHIIYSNLLSLYVFSNLLICPTRITSHTSTGLDHMLCNYDALGSLYEAFDTGPVDRLPIAFLYCLEDAYFNRANFASTTQLIHFKNCHCDIPTCCFPTDTT